MEQIKRKRNWNFKGPFHTEHSLHETVIIKVDSKPSLKGPYAETINLNKSTEEGNIDQTEQKGNWEEIYKRWKDD